MPLKSDGSVSARLRVCCSTVEPGGERGEVGVERLEPAGIEGGDAVGPERHVEGCPPGRAGLGQASACRGEVDRGQADPLRDGRARRQPAEAAGDHQVDDDGDAVGAR